MIEELTKILIVQEDIIDYDLKVMNNDRKLCISIIEIEKWTHLVM